MIRSQAAPLELQGFIGSAGYRQDAPLELHNPAQHEFWQVCSNAVQKPEEGTGDREEQAVARNHDAEMKNGTVAEMICTNRCRNQKTEKLCQCRN